MDIPGINKLAIGETVTGIYYMRKKSTFNKKENN